MTIAFLSILASTMLAQQADTTFGWRAGTRLDLRVQRGSVEIVGWERSEVSLRVVGGRYTVEDRDGVVRVQSRQSGSADLILRVPQRTPLTISGLAIDVSTSGVASDVSVSITSGSIDVLGAAGIVDVRTQRGNVVVDGVNGRTHINTGHGDVDARDLVGSLTIEAITGDVDVRNARLEEANIASVNSDVRFEGVFAANGRYRLASHNGDVTLAVPERANATLNVTSYNGDFESAFPVTLSESSRQQFTFVIGNGSAVVTLEAFNGDIRLLRR